MSRRVLLVSISLALALSAEAADWPNFRGLNRDGIYPQKGLNRDWRSHPPALLWRVPLSDEGYGGPAVANNKVFIVDHADGRDVVRALDLDSGSNLWTYSYAEPGGPNYGYTRATPAIDEGRVYTISRSGLLHCLDENTGRVIWSKNYIKELRGSIPEWDVAPSPLIDGAQLVVLPGGDEAAVAALDKRSGAVLWKGGGSARAGYATPVVATLAGRKQYVVFLAREVAGVDAASGRRLWGVEWKTSWDVNAATPLVIGDRVFITSGYKRGCAMLQIGRDAARILWENKNLVAHFSSPIYYDGHIYGVGDPGYLVCLDAATGQLRWRQSGFEKGGVVGTADGLLIAADGSNGHLVLCEMSPNGYNELGRIQPLGGQTWTAPIIAAGKLLVRNREALACLELMPPRP